MKVDVGPGNVSVGDCPAHAIPYNHTSGLLDGVLGTPDARVVTGFLDDALRAPDARVVARLHDGRHFV